LEWAIADKPMPGETVNGDQGLVVGGRGEYLVAVIDGLGHGEPAAAASSVAADTIRANPAEPLDNLLLLCHQAMIDTRGAAMTVARVDITASSLAWLGVGNVGAFLVRSTSGGTAPVDSPILSGGIVGYSLPPLSIRTVELRPGDVLLFATDGIKADFADSMRPGHDIADLARHVLWSSERGTDDALVLAARFRGRRD
jgi:hypothetical protein